MCRVRGNSRSSEGEGFGPCPEYAKSTKRHAAADTDYQIPGEGAYVFDDLVRESKSVVRWNIHLTLIIPNAACLISFSRDAYFRESRMAELP